MRRSAFACGLLLRAVRAQDVHQPVVPFVTRELEVLSVVRVMANMPVHGRVNALMVSIGLTVAAVRPGGNNLASGSETTEFTLTRLATS